MAKVAALLALLCAAVHATIVVTCVGDSITYGYPWGGSVSYPSVMQTLLGSNYTVYNTGASGTTMIRSTGASWYSSCGTWALSQNPNIVLIMLGTNDAKTAYWNETAYRSDYALTISQFAALSTKPKIYAIVPPPLFAEMWTMNQTLINYRYPVLIPQIATKNNVTSLLGVFNLFGGANLTNNMTYDNCHPNVEGYAAIAKYLGGVIKNSTSHTTDSSSSSYSPAASKSKVESSSSSSPSPAKDELSSSSAQQKDMSSSLASAQKSSASSPATKSSSSHVSSTGSASAATMAVVLMTLCALSHLL